MNFVVAFLVGGLLCTVGQVLMDKTRLTPARIMVGYVVTGVVLGSLGIYDRLIEFAGGGATTPLLGFGNNLANGMRKAIDEKGVLGIFTGALTAASAGLTAAMVFGYLNALIFKPKTK